jgi:preprotein translocase subunit SecD
MSELASALVEELRSRRLDDAVDEFVSGILQCMKDEHVNLEAAIASTHAYLEWQLNRPGVSDQEVEVNRNIFVRAAEEARQTLQSARGLVKADDDGGSEPVPLDAILAKREAMLAAQAEKLVQQVSRDRSAGGQEG